MRMFKLLPRVLCLGGLLALSSPVHANDLPTDLSDEQAAELLFLSTRSLLETSYKCQGVVGADTYASAKEMTVAMFKAMGADDKTTDGFITSQETAFRSECPDKATCWRTFMNMPTQSEDEGEAACTKKNSETLALIKSLLRIITQKDNG